MSIVVPFDPPHFLAARQTDGFIIVPTTASNENERSENSRGYPHDSHRGWDNSDIAVDDDPSVIKGPNGEGIIKARIVEIDNLHESESKGRKDCDGCIQPTTVTAFWLQRSLGHQSSSRDVVVRVGYKLRPANEHKEDGTNYERCRWQLDTDEAGHRILARIYIRRNTENILHRSTNQCRQSILVILNSPLNELSALHMIGHESAGESLNVDGTKLIASDKEFGDIYTFLPYLRDGTLMEFCQFNGALEESLARFIFRQILKGLCTLKECNLCHRNLSLDSISLDGDRVIITDLGWALKCMTLTETTNLHGFDEVGCYPPTPGGYNPHFIPPEWYLFQSSISDTDGNDGNDERKNVWSGFRDDLWAAGLVLYSMVVGIDALFSAPMTGDRTFVRLCVKGDIRGEIERYEKRVGRKGSNLLSDGLANLLQSMLNADPKKRLDLDQILLHPWVTEESLTSPTEWGYDCQP